FTRLNFGWWRFSDDIQPDMYEYGTSKAASWDCPVTMQVITEAHKTNPRAEDIFEVLYRWEDVRAKKLLTEEEKEMLKDASTEYILLVNEEKEYELCPYYRIETSEKDITAYHFERKGKTHVVCWHTKGDGVLSLPLSARSVTYEKDLGGVTSECEISTTSVSITVSGRRYFSADVSKDELIRAFENAVLQCNNV
ncbi:MAG: hypothetical protein IJN09_00030, partial [Oscillospiraceae bacterium]|nr:hypothetical protein [Oscillospiraceae bacterium]